MKKTITLLVLMLLLTPLASAGILRHSAKGAKKVGHAAKEHVAKPLGKAALKVAY